MTARDRGRRQLSIDTSEVREAQRTHHKCQHCSVFGWVFPKAERDFVSVWLGVNNLDYNFAIICL